MSRFRSRERMILLVVLLLGFALRLHRLGADSLWYDETVSALLASKSLGAMWAHTARDIHPPLYYALLHFWTALAGSSDFMLAFFSLWFGVALVALAAHLGLRAYGPRVGLLAAFLAAIQPLGVWYSQEVRMYTLGSFWLLLALIVLWRYLVQPRTGLLIAYAVLAGLSLWTLYYSAFALAALNLFVLPWLWVYRRRQLVPWLAAQAAALLLYAPWLPVAVRQATDPPVPPWREALAPLALLTTAWQEGSTALSGGQSLDPAVWWPLGLIGLAVALAAFALPSRLPGRKGSGSLLLWTSVAGPVLLILLVSFTFTPLYHVRYLALYSGAFPVLLAAGLAAIAGPLGRARPARLILAGGVLAILLVGAGASHRNYFNNRFAYEAADDLRGAVRFLYDHAGPSDAILVNAGYLYPALLHYWSGDIGWLGRLSDYPPAGVGEGPVVVLTGHVDGDPGIGWGDPASDFYAIPHDETAARLDKLFANADTVWELRGYDTVNDPTGFIRSWLAAHGDPYFDQAVPGQTFARVQAWRTSPRPRSQQPDIQHPRAATFGTVESPLIHLLGYDLAPVAPHPGDALRLTLYWQAAGPIDRSYKVFNQLVASDGSVVAQNDAIPGLGAYPTQLWQPGEFMESSFVLPLPAVLPPGPYRLITGFYDEATGVRLPLANGDDHVDLATVDVSGSSPR